MIEKTLISQRVESVNFGLYTDDEVKELSVKEISNPITFDMLHYPTIGGLYDRALGANEKNDVCPTCGATSFNCCGHMGHIQLPLPVFTPIHFETMYQIMHISCFKCHRLMLFDHESCMFVNKMRLANHGLLSQVVDLEEYVKPLITSDCKQPNIVIRQSIIDYTDKLIAAHDKQFGAVKNQQLCKQDIIHTFIKENMQGIKRCCHCQLKWRGVKQELHNRIIILGAACSKPKIKLSDKSMSVEGQDAGDGLKMLKSVEERGQTELMPLEARSHLRLVWENDKDFLMSMYPSLGKSKATYPTDMFFIQVLAVPPSKFRPQSILGDKIFENPMTANYCRVLDDCKALEKLLCNLTKDKPQTDITESQLMSDETTAIDLHKCWIALQTHVNCVVDSSLDRLSTDSHPGIKQLLEKKEGLFRKHMMGKRVNFAARTVITPDPCISTNEIGIPEIFAIKLTYPQPVTPWNERELRQAVLNGPDVHPGACYVQSEDGFNIMLQANDKTQREAVANQLLTPSTSKDGIYGAKIVMRHLKNGDMLLMNRQPTLHRPSIQAHRARILPGLKTMRLHYANCKAYNADFDGDEMNAHYPQNELARAEAYTLSSTDYQYLVPKDGKPLAGLIQDHMVAGVSLTMRGTFFTRHDYCRLVYAALVDKDGPIIMLPPSIIKPHSLWSGKQVVSTVLINVFPEGKKLLSMTGKSKIPEKSWIKDTKKADFLHQALCCEEMGESHVIIRNGELLCGVLDKGHYGATPYGLIHCCYELYGGPIAGKLLSSLGRLFMGSLQLTGFTLGVEDILVTRRGNKRRQKIIKSSLQCGDEIAIKALGLSNDTDDVELKKRLKEAQFSTESNQLRELDLSMKDQTNDIQNKIVTACMDKNLQKIFPENNLELMVKSGAKGTTVNSMQISCLLGQIELEGQRPPLMLSGRTLPSFLPYDTAPRAGGFVTGRFLTGIKPQEYFFHCMAGREGLVDTAVKTSRSGYLQRCLAKHLEGIMVNYDFTVRDSDSSVIQFHFGEDGFDICKSGFLKEKQIPFLIENCNKFAEIEDGSTLKVDKCIRKLEKKIDKWKKKQAHARNGCKSGFLNFCATHGKGILADRDMESEKAIKVLSDAWRQLEEKQQKKFSKHFGPCFDPVQAVFRQYEKVGVMPEKMSDILKRCSKSILIESGDVSEAEFVNMMIEKIEKSFVEPGDAVGLLAAQSIGEPSTQMTLNTFHFAGRGEMNVTLGIPRLREILMTATKNIQTPNMDIPIFNLPTARAEAKQLQRKFNKVTLAEVLQSVQIKETLSIKRSSKFDRHRIFNVRFNMLPPECFHHMYATHHSILSFIEKQYIKQLSIVIQKNFKHLSRTELMSALKNKSGTTAKEKAENDMIDQLPEEAEDEDMAFSDDDNDATTDKLKQKRQEEQEYEEDDEVVNDEEDEAASEDDTEDEEERPYFTDISQWETPLYAKKMKMVDKKKQAQQRVSKVINLHDDVIGYSFDIEQEHWCEIIFRFPILDTKVDLGTIIEDSAKKCVVHEVPEISQCFLKEQKGPGGPQLHFQTEGINIQEVYNYAKILDLNKLYTNNIYTISQTYGIEAANRAIIKEIVNVFGAYGIEVDFRHLSLVADYMTFEGSYKPFNRATFQSSVSPFQKMTFETTVNFLVKACMNADSDELKSPSAQLVTGRPVSCGTGTFELLQPLY